MGKYQKDTREMKRRLILTLARLYPETQGNYSAAQVMEALDVMGESQKEGK